MESTVPNQTVKTRLCATYAGGEEHVSPRGDGPTPPSLGRGRTNIVMHHEVKTPPVRQLAGMVSVGLALLFWANCLLSAFIPELIENTCAQCISLHGLPHPATRRGCARCCVGRSFGAFSRIVRK